MLTFLHRGAVGVWMRRCWYYRKRIPDTLSCIKFPTWSSIVMLTNCKTAHLNLFLMCFFPDIVWPFQANWIYGSYSPIERIVMHY
jgi:hypothetical protein